MLAYTSDLPIIVAMILLGVGVLGLLIWGSIYLAKAIGKGADGVEKFVGTSKKEVAKLEVDYTWRKVKVVYIAASPVIIAAAGLIAYENTGGKVVYYALGSHTTPKEVGPGLAAAVITAVVVWICYQFFLPKLYVYLRRPADRTQGRHPAKRL